MENVAHWTQQSTADFVYSISSTFVAQIETKMEEEEISRTELATRLKKSSGRVSQILNNPGNMGLKVMVETAGSLGMKVSVIAYDDHDPAGENGPIDPDVFVKCWEHAGRPANLFEAEDVCAGRALEGYLDNVTATSCSTVAAGQIYVNARNFHGYVGSLDEVYPDTKIMFEPAKILGNFHFVAPQLSKTTDDLLSEFQGPWQQQEPTILNPQEKAA
jgi:hypothetical protein